MSLHIYVGKVTHYSAAAAAAVRVYLYVRGCGVHVLCVVCVCVCACVLLLWYQDGSAYVTTGDFVRLVGELIVLATTMLQIFFEVSLAMSGNVKFCIALFIYTLQCTQYTIHCVQYTVHHTL